MMSLVLMPDSRQQCSGEAVLSIGGDVTLALKGWLDEGVWRELVRRLRMLPSFRKAETNRTRSGGDYWEGSLAYSQCKTMHHWTGFLTMGGSRTSSRADFFSMSVLILIYSLSLGELTLANSSLSCDHIRKSILYSKSGWF